MDTSIHERVAATLSELGLPVPSDVLQTMVLRDGYYVGWKFLFDGGHAILHADSNTIELFDEQGKLLKTIAAETAKDEAA